MKYYLGSYYLIKLQDSITLDDLRRYLYTPSTCINDSLLDGWSLPWVMTTPDQLKEAGESFLISADEIREIQSWADNKFNKEKIGWINSFYELETLIEYRNFFKNLVDTKILAIYFSENEKDRFLKEFDFEGKTTASLE